MTDRRTKQGYLLNTVLLIVLFALFQLATATFGASGPFKLVLAPCLWQCCYLILLASSLNLVLGFLGQLSLGHCGFMAIGAYTAALLSLGCERAGVFENTREPMYLVIVFACILAAGVLAALVGLLVGIPALRLKGDYLAIITLGFGMIIINIINNLPFCGQDGLSQGSAAASLYKNGLGFGTKSKVSFLWVAIVVTVVCMTMMFMFIRSKYGRAIKAIRDDEIAASFSGIDTGMYRVYCFAVASFFTGLAGAAMAHYANFASPLLYTTNESLIILQMAVLGGLASLPGSIVGAFIIVIVPELSRTFYEYRMLFTGVIMLLLMLFCPDGLFGKQGVGKRVIGLAFGRKKKNEGQTAGGGK